MNLSMNRHLQRAMVLLEQSRYDLAEKELRGSLIDDPNNGFAHAVLALCLSETKAFQEATQAAQQSILLTPDSAFSHYAMSRVLFERNHFPEALQSVQTAIELDAHNPQYFAMLAQIHLTEKRWQKALEAADNGLECDPEDVGCTNVRTMALVKLGKRDAAKSTLDAALQKNPEDPLTHANLGWTFLEKNDPPKAMHHFREALRLDPNNEWARVGIIEALKAQNVIYRLFLNYFLWMMKLSSRAQWFVLIGAYVGYRVLINVNRANPEWSPFIVPILVLYVVFAISTWVANPLFNLVLRFNKFGRMALSREQIITSNWIAICIFGAFAAVVSYFAVGYEGGLLVAIICALMIPPISTVYACDEGWPRTTILMIILGLGLLGGMSIMALLLGPDTIVGRLGVICFPLYLLGAIAAQFGVQVLASATVRH